MRLFTIRWVSSPSWRKTGSSQGISIPRVGKKKKEKGGNHLAYLEKEEGRLDVTFDKFPPYPLMFSGL